MNHRNRTRRTFTRLVLVAPATVVLALSACGGGTDEAAAPTPKPNVLVIMADDMGYSDIGAFGSEISTPTLDSLVADGRVLTRFYTSPACSPTRGMLMSGADSHRVGFGAMENNVTALIAARNAPFGVDFSYDNVPDGYGGHLLDSVVTMPQLLKDAGYHTYMAGKWHLAYRFRSAPTPGSTFQPSAYPNKKGFERSFALLNGAGAHFAPVPGAPLTTYDRTTYTEDDVEFPATSLPQDFYSSTTYTDKLISYIDSNRGDGKPFFGYLAYTAPHWPLQAPDADIAAQAGKYDEGYEVIRSRRIARMKQLGVLPANFVENAGLPSVGQGGNGKKRWSELTTQERAVQARAMEVYAAMVTNMDRNIGRLVKYLKDTGQYENTFILFISDNGSDSGSATGTATTANTPLATIGKPGSVIAYGERWAEVSAAPFRLWKTFTGAEGSVSVPAVVKMPGRNTANRPLTVPTLVKDILPTVLDLADIPVPVGRYAGREIVPISGSSLRSALASNADAPRVRPPNEVIAFEYFGQGFVHRGDGWKLSRTTPPGVAATSYADVPWRLYNMDTDRGETIDLAAANPDIVASLLAEWNRYVVDNSVITLARPPAGKRDPNSL